MNISSHPYFLRLYKEGFIINVGKDFENQFRASVPQDVYYQRIKDPAQSFTQNSSLRFSLQNPYDCFIYSYPVLFTLELKSTQGNSLTFYKKDLINDGKKHTFMIKKNQLEGLNESNKYEGIVSGLVINFRGTNHTYYLSIEQANNLINNIDKKSFNEQDVINHDGYLIEQHLKKVKYNYNLEKFIEDQKNYIILKEKFRT